MRPFVLACGLLLASAQAADPSPRLVLWAWERPEDLRFLRTDEAEVAFLAATVEATDGTFLLSPRMQPMRVNEGTALIAVVRLEAKGADLTPAHAGSAAEAIASVVQRDALMAMQVDFDATASQRAFYVELLRELRPRLPRGMRLEMTALASWCLFDDWLRELKPGLVDDIVPMAFRMGADADRVRQGLSDGKPLRCEACRGAFGISLDEPLPRLPDVARLHVFNPRAWTRADVDAVKARVSR